MTGCHYRRRITADATDRHAN
jgi:hypothetical protein